MTVTPAGHPIRLRRATDGRLWIDFSDLCVDTTAPSDYLALTESFQHWIISGIPGLLTAGREPTQRFANVIDVLYDRDITTTFISAVPLSEFTDGASLPHDIARIMSRLGQLATHAGCDTAIRRRTLPGRIRIDRFRNPGPPFSNSLRPMKIPSSTICRISIC